MWILEENKLYVVLDSSKIASPLQTPCPRGLHLRFLQIGLHSLGLWKQQQICHSRGSSSIGSCGIGRCSGSGSVGAAAVGCTPTFGIAKRGLVGSGGVLRLCPFDSRFTLVAQASPSWLALCACSLGFALAAWLCPHTSIKQQSSGQKICFGSAAAYLPQWWGWQQKQWQHSSGGIGCGSGRQRQHQWQWQWWQRWQQWWKWRGQ